LSPYEDIIFAIEEQTEDVKKEGLQEFEVPFLEMRYYTSSTDSELLKKSRKEASRKQSCDSNFLEPMLGQKLSRMSMQSYEGPIHTHLLPLPSLNKTLSSGLDEPNSPREMVQEDVPPTLTLGYQSGPMGVAPRRQSLFIIDFIVLLQEIAVVYLKVVLLCIESQQNKFGKLSVYSHLWRKFSQSARVLDQDFIRLCSCVTSMMSECLPTYPNFPNFSLWRMLVKTWIEYVHTPLHSSLDKMFFKLLVNERVHNVKDHKDSPPSSVGKHSGKLYPAFTGLSGLKSISSINEGEEFFDVGPLTNRNLVLDVLEKYSQATLDLSCNEVNIHSIRHSQVRVDKPYTTFEKKMLRQTTELYGKIEPHIVGKDFLERFMSQDCQIVARFFLRRTFSLYFRSVCEHMMRLLRDFTQLHPRHDRDSEEIMPPIAPGISAKVTNIENVFAKSRDTPHINEFNGPSDPKHVLHETLLRFAAQEYNVSSEDEAKDNVAVKKTTSLCLPIVNGNYGHFPNSPYQDKPHKSVSPVGRSNSHSYGEDDPDIDLHLANARELSNLLVAFPNPAPLFVQMCREVHDGR
jgi:hypothetical protein